MISLSFLLAATAVRGSRGSCAGECGSSKQITSGSVADGDFAVCFCRQPCLASGDCCSDFTLVCNVNAIETDKPPVAPAENLCANRCGSTSPVFPPGGQGAPCFCHSSCIAGVDCCHAFEKHCDVGKKKSACVCARCQRALCAGGGGGR